MQDSEKEKKKNKFIQNSIHVREARQRGRPQWHADLFSIRLTTAYSSRAVSGAGSMRIYKHGESPSFFLEISTTVGNMAKMKRALLLY